MNKIILLVLLCFLSSYVFAQEVKTLSADDSVNKAIHLKQVSKSFAKSNFSPFGGGSFSNLISNISVSSAFNEGENAKAELKYTEEERWLTFGLTVDQKIGKSTKSSIPFDLEGLSAGTTVGLNIQKMWWNPVVSDASFNNFQEAKKTYAIRENIADPRTITLMDIYTNGSKEEKKLINKVKLKTPIFFNLKYSFTKTQYDFVVDSSLVENSEAHITPSFTATLGIPVARKLSFNSYLALNYNYSESYEEGNELTITSPFGTSGNTVSRTVIYGTPSKSIDNKLNLEWRINLDINQSAERSMLLGIAPSATYGLDSKNLAVNMPIYFINGRTAEGKPSGLQGGVRLRYLTSLESGMGNSFQEGFGAQLIVTAPFEIF